MSKKLKVMLVIPPGGYYAERWKKGSMMPSLGICYIASVLEKEGHQVAIIDGYVEGLSMKALLSRVKEFNPDFLGTTFTTENRFGAFDLIRRVRQMLPHTFINAGGPHASLAADDTLRHIPELDAIIRGEGEQTAVLLARALANGSSLKHINGLSYRPEGKIIHNPDVSLIADLDTIPFPAWHLVPWENYNFTLDVPGRGPLPAANIMTSRGCPFNCNFCASTRFWGRSFRTRSVDNILEEIKLLRDRYHIKALWIFDDTFTVSKEKVAQFCHEIINRKWDLNWFCESRVDTVDRELLTLMKKGGCYSIGFGVESGSQRILDEVIGKKTNLEQVKETARACKELGIISNPFFIFSHPEETKEDIEKTMDLIRNWPRPSSISLSLLHIYPGTRLEEIARDKGIIPANFSWTRKNDPRVTILPTAQGHVPIFIDKLSLQQLTEYIFQWRSRQGYVLWKKIPELLLSIRSPRDLLRYFTMLRGYIRHKLGTSCN